jgi:hypothetical protein
MATKTDLDQLERRIARLEEHLGLPPIGVDDVFLGQLFVDDPTESEERRIIRLRVLRASVVSEGGETDPRLEMLDQRILQVAPTNAPEKLLASLEVAHGHSTSVANTREPDPHPGFADQHEEWSRRTSAARRRLSLIEQQIIDAQAELARVRDEAAGMVPA